MFYKCIKINSLPNLSNWSLKNCIYNCHIFDECYNLLNTNLLNLPAINNDVEENKSINNINNLFNDKLMNDLGFNDNSAYKNIFDNNMDDSFDEKSNENLFENNLYDKFKLI